mmetsp:Transcript_1729/g.3737  ORF Transcript_1729/g.3737 Transcript_1729/m.3737 type:complete len:115 (-) Transcript_1729:1425-1769(-)
MLGTHLSDSVRNGKRGKLHKLQAIAVVARKSGSVWVATTAAVCHPVAYHAEPHALARALAVKMAVVLALGLRFVVEQELDLARVLVDEVAVQILLKAKESAALEAVGLPRPRME